METFGFGASLSKAADDVIGSVKSAGSKLLDVIDPRAARLQLAGLAEGGVRRNTGAKNSKAKFADSSIDWRVKLSLANDATYFYKTGTDAGLLEPLRQSGGVIFPYTPSISVTHAARYNSQALTHSNYTNYSYEGSEVQSITIAGEFTAQNNVEAAYVLACIQFFRAATKMWFGAGASGNPPPMVFLNGYGTHYFPNVPCVVTSFQHTLPSDVDYISAITADTNEYSSESRRLASYTIEDVNQSSAEDRRLGITKPQYNPTSRSTNVSTTMIPTTSTLSVTLQPIYSRKNVFENSNLDRFAKGDLIGNPKAGKGGFI